MEVYLDNSATTRPSAQVVAAMQDALTAHWHNPSALYKPALAVEKLVSAAREACLEAAHARGQRLIFTSGGTEADNIAILGHLRTVRKPGRVLITGVEHPAVSACAAEIERLGHQVAEIPVRRDGVVDGSALRELLDDSVRLICVMQVNNEVGAVQPLAEIAALRDAACPQAALHVDGVQGFLRVPFDFNHSGVQSYAFSGHKLHACKGVGVLIVRQGHKISPIVFGGGQEDGYRSGTENTPGIIGLGEAVRGYPADAAADMAARKRQLWAALREAVPAAVLNGPAVDDVAAAPHILNVSFPPVRSQTMLFALEGDGVIVSSGSACASRKQRISGVLSAMGVPHDLADSAIRFSLCPGITEAEIAYAAEMVKKHYALLARYVRR